MYGPKDAFKYATEPSWQVAWKDRIEPDLQDYVGFSSNMIKFPKEDSNIALYDNFYSARYFYFIPYELIRYWSQVLILKNNKIFDFLNPSEYLLI